MLYIILFLHQTTTGEGYGPVEVALYIILFLHQTTTFQNSLHPTLKLYTILFLHQTTTSTASVLRVRSCILSYFYIKPQQSHPFRKKHGVVYYPISTSNHNSPTHSAKNMELYIILFLHQTTTSRHR